MNSKIEALQQADKNMKKYLETTFCPLLRDKCRSDCVCFAKPSCYKGTKSNVEVWFPNGGHCVNAMFTGL